MNEAAGIEASLGLTSEEAQARIVAGEANVDAGVKTRSIGQIVHDNVCTLFNLVNLVLALIVLFTGSSAETTPISKTKACACLSSAAMIRAPFPASLKRWGWKAPIATSMPPR